MNTDTDTSVFENHTGYWILVFSFCTGQVSDLDLQKTRLGKKKEWLIGFLATVNLV